MKRYYETHLQNWWQRLNRKPLVIRGARQVGKSTLVRQFASNQGLNLAEVNLERRSDLNDLFKTNDIHAIIMELEALAKTSLSQPGTLLFLDEIQSTPDALASLRYFYEDMPDLPVIVAGSLLEFVLANHHYSMPVGRIEYLHLGPMSFLEFLEAMDEFDLIHYISTYTLGNTIPQIAHERLLQRQREYLFIGGMPEAVLTYRETKSIQAVLPVHRSIVQTYQDDFPKHAGVSDRQRMHVILNQLPRTIGKKVVYAKLSPGDRANEIKRAIDILSHSRIITKAMHTDASGLPFKAGVNEKFCKLFFVDIGLFNYLSGLQWDHISSLQDRELINEGALAEQFIAQHLAYRYSGLEAPDLYYWLREESSQNAEVDFITQVGRDIIPIEVKSGKSGSLKSLQQFNLKKNNAYAIRFDLNLPSQQTVNAFARHKNGVHPVSYHLISLPLYLIECLPSLHIE